jgi:hypothetical protein
MSDIFVIAFLATLGVLAALAVISVAAFLVGVGCAILEDLIPPPSDPRHAKRSTFKHTCPQGHTWTDDVKNRPACPYCTRPPPPMTAAAQWFAACQRALAYLHVPTHVSAAGAIFVMEAFDNKPAESVIALIQAHRYDQARNLLRAQISPTTESDS